MLDAPRTTRSQIDGTCSRSAPRRPSVAWPPSVRPPCAQQRSVGHRALAVDRPGVGREAHGRHRRSRSWPARARSARRSSTPRVASASWGTSSRRVSVVDNTEVVIKVRDNGPYKVTGPVAVVDAAGNRFELDGEPIARAGAGARRRKPFGDASHRTTGFAACDRAVSARGDSTRAVHAGLPAPSAGEPFLPGPTFAAPYHSRATSTRRRTATGATPIRPGARWRRRSASSRGRRGRLRLGHGGCDRGSRAGARAGRRARRRRPTPIRGSARSRATSSPARGGGAPRAHPPTAFEEAAAGATLVWAERPRTRSLDVPTSRRSRRVCAARARRWPSTTPWPGHCASARWSSGPTFGDQRVQAPHRPQRPDPRLRRRP